MLDTATSDGVVLLQTHVGRGLGGLRELLAAREDIVKDVAMDIIPYLVSFHHSYTEPDGDDILYKLLLHGSPKELCLGVLEQLAQVPCYNSLALLLPLLTDYRDIIKTLVVAVCNSELCVQCADEEPTFAETKMPEKAILECILNIEEEEGLLQDVALHLTDQSMFSEHPHIQGLLLRCLKKLKLTFSQIIRHRTLPDSAGYIVCSAFQDIGNNNTLPQVYLYRWLFSCVIPWTVVLLEYHPDLALTALTFFTKQHFIIQSSSFNQLTDLLEALVLVAVSNTKRECRRAATNCIVTFSNKLKLSDTLKLVKVFCVHNNGGVAALYLDQFKQIISQPRIELTHHKVLIIAGNALNIDYSCDILSYYDRVMSTLSLLQLIGIRNLPLLEKEAPRYLTTVTELVKRKQIELRERTPPVAPALPATLRVQGELVREPSREEQLQSLELAQCRLDLIMYNLARCREYFHL